MFPAAPDFWSFWLRVNACLAFSYSACAGVTPSHARYANISAACEQKLTEDLSVVLYVHSIWVLCEQELAPQKLL